MPTSSWLWVSDPEERGRARGGQEPVTHAIPATEITAVGIGIPAPGPQSPAAQAMQAMGLVSFHAADDHVLDLTFDQALRGDTADLRPELPLILRW